jgi:hypothetical protein
MKRLFIAALTLIGFSVASIAQTAPATNNQASQEHVAKKSKSQKKGSTSKEKNSTAKVNHHKGKKAHTKTTAKAAPKANATGKESKAVASTSKTEKVKKSGTADKQNKKQG